jgi:hypothetical protein
MNQEGKRFLAREESLLDHPAEVDGKMSQNSAREPKTGDEEGETLSRSFQVSSSLLPAPKQRTQRKV